MMHWQANQRVYEWRNSFGCTAVTILNSFFSDGEDFSTDEDCAEFAQSMMQNLIFLYTDAEASNPKVRIITMQK